jgi:DNA polymerase-3 subunit delta'
MPYFPTLVGSDDVKSRIGETIRSDRLSHAYLIEGRSGSGKRTLSRLIAAAVSCLEQKNSNLPLPCGRCSACQKILNEKTPDVRYLDRGDKATLSVEAIRDLRSEMSLSATELDHKFFIIDDADSMTPAAQNALLISLEEPPPNVVILLLAETSEALLPTIRSRTQLLRMGYVDEASMREYLLQNNQDAASLFKNAPDKLSAIISAADGRIGEAIRLLSTKTQNELFKKRQIVLDLVVAFAKASSFSSIYSATMKLPTKRAELSEILAMASDALRDLCTMRRYPDAKLLFFLDKKEAVELAEKADYMRLFASDAALRRAQNDLASNANVGITLTALAVSVFTME